MKRNAQISIFIILGLIIVLSVIAVVYVVVKTQVITPVESLIPEEARPVYDFVVSCAYQDAKDAITRLGMQSGYVEIPDFISRDTSAYIALDSINMIKLPYWYHNAQSRAPSIAYMEAQIRDYIEENIPNCLDNFSAFEGQYNIVPESDLSAYVTIAEEDIVVVITYPMEIQSKEKVRITSVEKFPLKVDVKLKQMHDLAVKTMKFENDNEFFENVTINLMASSPEIPFDALEFECGQKVWYLDEVEDEVKSLLYFNLPFVRVKNTDHPPFEGEPSDYEKLREYNARVKREVQDIESAENPETYLERVDAAIDKVNMPYAPDDAYEYFQLYLDPGIAPVDLKAMFDYQQNWNFNMMAYPSSGGVMKSNKADIMQSFLSFLCINQYHFTYDLMFPVRMTLRDDSAFKGEGFLFQFAFPVLIKENEGDRRGASSMKFTDFQIGREFCRDFGNRLVDVRAQGVFEGYTGMDIPDVNISYHCADQICHLGKTSSDDGVYRLRTYLPAGCSNPFIVASKPGYVSERRQLKSGQDMIIIPITKMKPMNYSVVKHPYYYDEIPMSQWGDPVPFVEEADKALIYLNLIGHEAEYYQFLDYPSSYQDHIEFVEGEAQYELNIMLTQFGRLTGGYVNPNITVTYDDIGGRNEVVFHVFEYRPRPREDDDKAQLNMSMFMFSGKYHDRLKPEFGVQR